MTLQNETIKSKLAIGQLATACNWTLHFLCLIHLKRTNKSNLRKIELQALNYFLQNKNIIIHKADKDNTHSVH